MAVATAIVGVLIAVCHVAFVGVSGQIFDVDRAALQAMKDVSTNWWNFPEIRCYSADFDDSLRIVCNGNSRVQEINFDNLDLGGTIAPEIGDLTELSTLDLRFNGLSGSIPSSIGRLTNLRYLYLHNNMLTGSIPSSFNQLTSLGTCYLRNNRLSGGIPPIDQLKSLRSIDLSSNYFIGPVSRVNGQPSCDALEDNCILIPSLIPFDCDTGNQRSLSECESFCQETDPTGPCAQLSLSPPPPPPASISTCTCTLVYSSEGNSYICEPIFPPPPPSPPPPSPPPPSPPPPSPPPPSPPPPPPPPSPPPPPPPPSPPPPPPPPSPPSPPPPPPPPPSPPPPSPPPPPPPPSPPPPPPPPSPPSPPPPPPPPPSPPPPRCPPSLLPPTACSPPQVPPLNRALNKGVFQTSTSVGCVNCKPKNIVDGNVPATGTFNSSSCTSTLVQPDIPYVVIDLKQVICIDRVLLYSRSDNQVKNVYDYFNNVEVWISTINQYFACATQCDPSNLYTYAKNGIAYPYQKNCQGMRGRWLWVRTRKKTQLTLCEVEVYE